MTTRLPSTVTRRRRVLAGIGLSLALHGTAAWLLSRPHAATPARDERPVEIAVLETPPAPPSPAPAAPEGRPETTTRPTKRASSRVRAAAPTAPPATAEGTAPGETHPLMRMRGGAIDLTPGADTLARALGPVEAPPAEEKPRRKPRLPGTGLTTLEPEIDNKKPIHPRAFEVLTKVERLFRPDRQRTADEVAGDLRAATSIKRWLFGSLANDPEALRNKVPTLACLVCVTLRPGVAPEVELSGPSGSPWFDSAAIESLRRAAVPERPNDRLDPARACYRFSAKVWRTRPDLTNLAVPFKLNFSHRIQVVSYERLGS